LPGDAGAPRNGPLSWSPSPGRARSHTGSGQVARSGQAAGRAGPDAL